MTWLINRIVPPQEEGVSERTTAEFETPALGDAFGFLVVIRCTQQAGARRHEKGVWSSLDEEREAARELIHKVVREECRRHSPFSPGTAEREANKALDREFAGHPTLKKRWSARVEVGLTDDVRELERRSLVEQHDISAHAKAVALRLRALDELRRQAETFLAGLNANWASRYAVRLAQQPELASEIVHRMLEDRKEDAEHLVRTVQAMVDAHQTANIYELVISSEGALRQALERLGVPLPPLDTDPLFVPADIPR